MPSRYKTVELLGSGVSGEVYKVEDTLTGNTIALKILANVDPAAADTLANEFKTLSSIKHTHLIKVYDFGLLENNIPFFTMEIIEGDDLHNFLAQKNNIAKLPLIIEQIISTLAYLHERKIIHSDIKPENVMIINRDDSYSVKLLDFGLAAASGIDRKTISGTPRFLSPEILKEKEYSESSDLYALGMTLVECITGEEIPLSTKIESSFYDRNYSLLSRELSTTGAKNAFSLSSFILDLCRTERTERINSSEEALRQVQLLSETGEGDIPALSENILIGRSNELDKITAFIDVPEKFGETIILEGSRGVGKKRLIDEAVRKAQLAGYIVFDLSNDIFTTNSFDRFIELLSENLPPEEKEELLTSHRNIIDSILEREKAEKPSREDNSVIIYDNIIQFIDKLSSKQPILFSIPDIQRFGADFLGFISHLAYETDVLSSKTKNILSNNEEFSRSKPEQDKYDEIKELESVLILEVGPLNKKGIRELTDSLLEKDIFTEKELEKLHIKTNGIPLFVVEIIKHLIDKGILELIEGEWQLDRAKFSEFQFPEAHEDIGGLIYKKLSRMEKNILQAITIYDREIPIYRLAGILSEKATQLKPVILSLIEKGLIDQSENKLSIINPLLRDYIHSHISWKKKVKLNRIIGELLEREEVDEPERLAKHFIAARIPDKAMKYTMIAQKRLKERYEIYDYLELLQKLKILFKKHKNSEKLTTILELIAPIELQLGLINNSIHSYERLIELSGNIDKRALFYKNLGYIYSMLLGRKTKPIKLLNNALRLSHKSKNTKLKCEILLELALIKEGKRISITKKAVELARTVDKNIYALSLSNLLYQQKIKQGTLKNKNHLNVLLSLLKKVNIFTKKRILLDLSFYFFFSADYINTEKYLKMKLKLEEETNDEINKAETLRILGGIYYINGDFHKLIDILRKLKNKNLKYKSFLFLITDISNIALAYTRLAEYNKAISHLRGGEEIIDKYNIDQVYHRFLVKFCALFLTLGDEKEKDFIKYYELSKENALQYNNTIRFGHTQLYKSQFHYQRLQYDKATKYSHKALKAFRDTNDRDDIVEALITLSIIEMEDGKIEEAASHIQEARSIYDEIHCKYLQASLLQAEGMLARRQQSEETESILKRGLKASRKMGTRETTWQIYRELALYYKDIEKINEAISNYRNSIETIRQITESIDGDKLKKSYLSVPFRKRVFGEIKRMKRST